jgi:hypothetical protein
MLQENLVTPDDLLWFLFCPTFDQVKHLQREPNKEVGLMHLVLSYC